MPPHNLRLQPPAPTNTGTLWTANSSRRALQHPDSRMSTGLEGTTCSAASARAPPPLSVSAWVQIEELSQEFGA